MGGIKRPHTPESPALTIVKKTTHLEESSLEASEGTTNSQICLLSSIHRKRLVFVRLPQILHRNLDFVFSYRSKMGSIDPRLHNRAKTRPMKNKKDTPSEAKMITDLRTHDRSYCINNFEADILSFPITIKPKNKRGSPFGFFLEKINHIELRIGLLFFNLRGK